MEIRPENTAISNGISKSTLEVEKLYSPGLSVLDYGAGKLRNAIYLLSKNIDTHILDSKLQISRIDSDILNKFSMFYYIGDKIESIYDIVLCSYVINVIPSPSDRGEVLTTIYKSLKENGTLVLEVRKEKGILSNKNLEPYNDGYVVGKGEIKTFQKPYTCEELHELLKKYSYKEVSIINKKDSIIAICKK